MQDFNIKLKARLHRLVTKTQLSTCMRGYCHFCLHRIFHLLISSRDFSAIRQHLRSSLSGKRHYIFHESTCGGAVTSFVVSIIKHIEKLINNGRCSNLQRHLRLCPSPCPGGLACWSIGLLSYFPFFLNHP